jgi:hypothetical protein
MIKEIRIDWLFFGCFLHIQEGKGTSPYSRTFSNIFFLIYNKMWVFHIFMCLGRIWRQIHGGNRLSRDWRGGQNHHKNLNVNCTKKAFISLVLHIVCWHRYLRHETTPIIQHNIHIKRNLGANKITVELTPWIPPKTPELIFCFFTPSFVNYTPWPLK